MDTEAEVKRIAKKLRKIVEKDRNHDEAMGLLEALKESHMTLEILTETKIGVIVNDFRTKSKDDEAKSMAKDIVKLWKKKFVSKSGKSNEPKEKKRSENSEDQMDSVSEGFDSPCAGTSEQVAQSLPYPFKLSPSATTNEERIRARELLASSLECPNHIGVNIELLAATIEDHIFSELQETGIKYKNRIRSRAFNLRDQANPKLKESVLSGTITAERIALMTSKEMASDELKKEIRQYVKDSIVDYSANKNVKGSDFYKCGRCGQRNTTYTQAQTRSADEPMTTFVCCNNCGKRWKHC